MTWSTKSSRSARSSSTSRYDSEKRKYQPTASGIISGSNWRHLNRPATEGARTISAQLAYQSTPAKLQHFLPRRAPAGQGDLCPPAPGTRQNSQHITNKHLKLVKTPIPLKPSVVITVRKLPRIACDGTSIPDML